ncbi:MAG: efflux RND transporter permease subunit [Phaeodactylibacter sp.]|nr:efflux RND transporter permease subunit [Phaeodactylibacter sp.]MCB9290037.1 efflux RND transporter permease subunit [Lewinellaceae bacterium]
MRGIITSSLRGRLAVVSLAVLLIVLVISQLREMQLGIYPEFSPVFVEVQTEALGLSAEEVEQLLTVALEQDLLNGIAFLDEIWSESMPGLSRVICVFEPGTDPMVARQVVAERLTQAHALPHVSKPPVMLQPYSSTSRVMKVGLSPNSPNMSLINLSVLARWTIQPYLMGVEGVANVSIWGQRKRQLQVQVNPETLKDKGVTLHDVVKTTGEALWVSPLSYLNSSTPGTGGFFDTPNQRMGIRHLSPISTAEQLAEIPVHARNNMLLKDVSTVVENHQPLIGDAIVNGSEGLLLVIEKFPWASTTQVSENIEDALDKLAPGLNGVAFDTEIYQPARFVEASLDNLTTMLGLGLAIIALLLFLFLYEWRAALISLAAIALSLMAGAYVLHLWGTIFDMMAIAGFIVALGIIIDDAIVTVDNIRRRLDHARDNEPEKSTAGIILEATLEMRSPVFIASLILLLAAIPLFFAGGLTGAFLDSIATSYLLALAASTLTALVVTPALCMMLLPASAPAYRTSPLLASLSAALGAGLSRFAQKPATAYATLGVIGLVGILSLSAINLSPEIPIPRERGLVIQWDAAYGTSRTEMARVTKEVISKLRTIPGIDNAAAHIGRAVMSDKITNVHSAEIWASMDEEADYEKTLASMRQLLKSYPEMNSNITTYLEQSLRKPFSGTNHLYAVRIYGEGQDVLGQKAEELKKAISGVRGVVGPNVEYPATEPTLEIEVDMEKAKQHNIKPGDVRRTAATLVAGIEAGSLFEGQKVFEVVVWGVPEVRNSIENVRNLLVDTPDGNKVRIGDVADVREKENLAVIRRDKVSRYMDITFGLSGVDINTAKNEIEESFKQVEFPLEYHAELVGNFLELQENRSRLTGVAVACLIGILLLLQAAFWSWRLALAVLPTLLIALSGGLAAIWLSGGTMEMGYLAGLLAALGVAAYQAVLLIKHFKHLELLEGETFGPALVSKGLANRLGPILMTTLTSMAAFLPLAFMGSAPGFEVLQPLALVMLGGLITTFVANLFVLPGLYLAFGEVSEAVMEEEKAMLDLDVAPSI